MKKNFPVIILFTIFFNGINAQVYKGQVSSSKVPAPSQHYLEEYTFDTTLNPSAWATVNRGMHVSFASSNALYFRTEVPEAGNTTSTFEATAWKGERLNIPLLIWSADTLQQVRLEVHDLKNKTGKLISAKNIQVNLVRYVISNYPYGAKDATCGESPYKDLYLMPDRFEPMVPGNDRFPLPGKTVRPVWITLNIPADAEAGMYEGTVRVKCLEQTLSLPLHITVQNQVLPSPQQWKHRLDLWQNPWVVAWKNHVQPWSEEHRILLKKHLKLYADAGGTFITTYGVHSPWSDNSYTIEGGMIDWIKKKDGSWKFDYSIFDQYVQLAMSVGINKAITLYTPVPWGFRFRYMDERTGNYNYESWQPESTLFKANWNIFLTDFKKHLEKKGWFNITYLGINENEMAQTLAAIRVIKEHSRAWKITYAGDWHPELDSLLNDYCFLYGKESSPGIVNARAARGQTTTYYVCCNPPVPNNFVYSPPVEGRWISWYTAAHHYDGFLRWAYDAWPADENRDARHPFWPAGDCFLVYPGGNSCIRFEKLREGIVDYEKMRILREKAARSTDKTVRELLGQLDQHLLVFLEEKDFNTATLIEQVDKGRKLLEQLSARL